MIETYARGGQEGTTIGAVTLAVASCLAAALVIAGLVYAAGTSERHDAALAAAGCEPGLSPSGLPCTTAQMLNSQFVAITTPTGQQLNADVDAYTANEGNDRTAAEAALTAEVISERAFGTSLAGIKFPSAIVPIAQALIRANQARATLTAEQARSSSLTRMRSFNRRVQVANTAVKTQVKRIYEGLR